MSKGAQVNDGENHRDSQPELEATHGLWTDLCGTCMGTTRSYECGWSLHGLIYLRFIILVHEMEFWSTLPKIGYIAKLDSGGGPWFCLNLVSQNFVTLKEMTIPSEEWVGVGWWGKVWRQEKGKEKKLGLGCKFFWK